MTRAYRETSRSSFCRRGLRPMVRKHSASRLWANGRLSQNTPIAGAHVFALVPVLIAAVGERIGCLRNQLFSETLRLIVVIEGASWRAHSAPSAAAERGAYTAPGTGAAALPGPLLRRGHGELRLRPAHLTGARQCRLSGGTPTHRPGRDSSIDPLVEPAIIGPVAGQAGRLFRTACVTLPNGPSRGARRSWVRA